MAEVIVYSSDSCGYCVAAKQYLNENNIEFIEKNINKDMEARNQLIKMGHMGVPVILVDDEEVVGFDKVKLDDLLGL